MGSSPIRRSYCARSRSVKMVVGGERRPPSRADTSMSRRSGVVSQFETMATQSPPIHRAGGAGGALGNPIGLSGPPPAVGCRYACHDVRRRVSQGPTHPARPLRGAHGRIDDSRGEALVRDLKRLRAPNVPTTGLIAAVIVGQFHERPSLHDSAARATRGGRERWVSLRKPVVVRRARRTAYRHSGGRLDGPIGFPKAHPSLPPGERAVRVRTETLPEGNITFFLVDVV